MVPHDPDKRERVALGNARLKKAIVDGAAGDGWQKRVEATLERLLDTVEADPYLAELCLVHASGLEAAATPFDPVLVQTLAAALRPKRNEGPEARPGPRIEELVAVGILSVVAERLRRGEAESLRGLAGELSVLATGPARTDRSGKG
jgi:hypothetical protein